MIVKLFETWNRNDKLPIDQLSEICATLPFSFFVSDLRCILESHAKELAVKFAIYRSLGGLFFPLYIPPELLHVDLEEMVSQKFVPCSEDVFQVYANVWLMEPFVDESSDIWTCELTQIKR